MKCVARHLNILIWSYLTWPWPLLHKMSVLICYLLNPLGSLLADFGLKAVISPVSVADKAKNQSFDLWPGLDLTCDLIRKNAWKVLESFCFPPYLPPFSHMLSWSELGGEWNLPPPPSLPAGHGLGWHKFMLQEYLFTVIESPVQFCSEKCHTRTANATPALPYESSKYRGSLSADHDWY